MTGSRIFQCDVVPFIAALEPAASDIEFADPPYESRVLDRVIDSWRTGRFARILAVEHAAEHARPSGGQRHTFGASTVTIYRARLEKSGRDFPTSGNSRNIRG